jgi:hypothetical protein
MHRTVLPWVPMRRRIAAIAALAAVGVLAVVAWRFGRALTLSLALAAPTAEPWVAVVRAAPVREEISIPAGSEALAADLYRPARARVALLLVHGLSRAGRRQPDLARLATLLGRHGVLVVVPQFEGLAAFRLSGREVADVRAALRYTAALSPSPGIAGFSFGAGPALLAAADVAGLRVVGSFGGYADLAHVMSFVTTGVHSYGGQRQVQRQEEYNRWKLLALLVGFVSDRADQSRLEEIARRKLAWPEDDTRSVALGLGPEGRAVLALVVNQREEAVAPLLAQLPPPAREELQRLSPLAAMPRIRARVLLAHGTADDSIPFTESLRLAEAAGDRARLSLFHTFHHTGPVPLWTSLWGHGRDGWALVRLVDELLSD